ncbi:MAG: lactate dehydrogenase [Chloroflexi bacterium]|nr:lactate dehydrogenase [Chloroflexota bacterium]
MGKKLVFYSKNDKGRTLSRSDRAKELCFDNLDCDFLFSGEEDYSNSAKIREGFEENLNEMIDAEVIICNGELLSGEMLKKLPNLRHIQLLSAGFDGWDIDVINELGINICGNSPAISNSVAEHTIALIMMLYKRLAQAVEGVKQDLWMKNAITGPYGNVHEITGKNVGIVGLGNIGSKVAKLLKGFDVNIYYHDIKEFVSIQNELNVKKVSFEKLLKISDIVSIHVPLSEQTRGLFSTKEFSLMKNSSIFINTCRGPVHDEKSLISALKNNEILGAGLDVTEVEPISKKSELLKMDNCVVTPHLAGSSKESVDRRIIFAFENASKTLMGIKPENII